MKKILSIIFICVVTILSITGCKSNTSSNKLTVTIWDQGQEAGLREILNEFTKETGIETELQVITWDSYWTLLEAGASGGDMPDVFWMHSNQATKYMKNDILLDLTSMINESSILNVDKFKEDILDMYTYEGKIYAIPKDIDTIALWYNKTMFDEANIPYPDETWTWETFYDVAKKLTKEDGSQYGLAMNTTNNQDGYYNIIYSMGGSVISDDKTKSEFNSENTVKAMNFVGEMIKTVMPPVNVMAETGTDTLLSSGKIAMLTQGSWMVAPFKQNEYIVQNCDVAIIPKNNDGKRVSLYNGLGWSVSANTKNPEGALKLVEWLGSENMQRKQADLGVTMSAYEGVSDNWVNSAPFNLQAYLDVLDEDKAELVIRPYSKDTLVWENMLQQQLKESWSGNITMEENCNLIAEKMNEMLKNEQ
ncbi:ABC transporter substrate-binding protein [[Clostridium] colinum]|uniref:ABC transporter substrate-binding protein n=1 Tax=[Clostridium] colinum TaxID=36835 RepID=UPI0020251B9A|nr:sugar ABC transporter substrate-binding protein [[Clostridium] colinum]